MEEMSVYSCHNVSDNPFLGCPTTLTITIKGYKEQSVQCCLINKNDKHWQIPVV